MSYQSIFDRLWASYAAQNEQVLPIRQIFEDRGDRVINDHIALRTFNHHKLNVEKLAEVFIQNGYKECDSYDFPVKKLTAKHYEHESDKEAPKVFISELLLEHFSDDLQQTINNCIAQIPDDISSKDLLFSERPWSPISHDTYLTLLAESEYAAWMYAYGYRANHFTVNINALNSFENIEDLNQCLLDSGFELNNSGGLIKGTPADYLEQSSTLASKQQVEFTEGCFAIPSCYFEFAKRYPMQNGELYTGFVAASADKIFESTDVKAD